MIVFVTPYFKITSPEIPCGGIESHGRGIVLKFKQLGVEALVISYDNIPAQLEVKEGNVIHCILPATTGLFGKLKLIFKIQSCINSYTSRWKIRKIYVQGISYLLFSIPQNFCSICYPIVHGIMYREYNPIINNRFFCINAYIKWIAVSLLEYLSYCRFKKVVVINDEMKHLFGSKETIKLRNSIPSQLVNNYISDTTKRPIVLCVGNIIPRKRQLLLAEIFIELKLLDWELIYVGSDSTEYANLLKKKVKPYSNIKVLSGLSDDKLVNVYKTAAIFCLPSASESSPISILEAMAANCIIVASAVGGIPELSEYELVSNSFITVNGRNSLKSAIKKATNNFNNIPQRYSLERLQSASNHEFAKLFGGTT